MVVNIAALHSIGGCSFGLIDILVGMDDGLSGQGDQVDPSGSLRSNGRAGARRSVPHQVPARRVHGAPHRCRRGFRHLTEFGTVRSSQGALGARHLVTACRATRDGHASRRSSTLTQCKACTTAVCIYKYQHGCRYTEVMADVGKNLSALARRSGQLRPYVRPVMRHSPLAIMGVRLRARHRSVWRTRGTQLSTVLPELSN
jgi:hypothetical protein